LKSYTLQLFGSGAELLFKHCGHTGTDPTPHKIILTYGLTGIDHRGNGISPTRSITSLSVLVTRMTSPSRVPLKSPSKRGL
jgi:hypothetical protein